VPTSTSALQRQQWLRCLMASLTSPGIRSEATSRGISIAMAFDDPAIIGALVPIPTVNRVLARAMLCLVKEEWIQCQSPTSALNGSNGFKINGII